MLESLRLNSIRYALVSFLLTLSAFIVMERAQAVVNGVEHALAIEHAAPGLVLVRIILDEGRDEGHEHGAAVGEAATDEAQDRAPGPQHHHHAEGPQVAVVLAVLTLGGAMSRSEAKFRLTDSGSPQSRIFSVDRPPKSLIDRV